MDKQLMELVGAIVEHVRDDPVCTRILEGLISTGGTVYFTSAIEPEAAIRATVTGGELEVQIVQREPGSYPTLDEWEAAMSPEGPTQKGLRKSA